MAVNMQLENDLGSRSRGSGSSGNGEVHVIGEPGPSTSNDDVRPPIPPTREVLVDTPVYDYSSLKKGKRLSRSRQPLTVFDGFRDFQAESSEKSHTTVIYSFAGILLNSAVYKPCLLHRENRRDDVRGCKCFIL